MPRVPLKERLSYSTYASLGWSHRQIARRFKRKRATIERWLDPVFHFPGEELEETQFRHPITQKVWACVSAGGPGAVVFFDGTLNAEKYKDILANRLKKTAKKLFGKSEWKVVCFTIPVLIFCFLVSI